MSLTQATIRSTALLAALAAGQALAAQGPPPPPPPPGPVPPVPVPAENPITEAKRVLGKILFWDEQLSSDNTVACGSCHLTEIGGADRRVAPNPGFDGSLGTADDIDGSPGIVHADANDDYEPDSTFGLRPQATGRAAPSFFGGLWSPTQFWDGRAGGRFVDPESGSVGVRFGGSLESQTVEPPVNDVEMAHANRDWGQIAAKLATVDPLRLATDWPADVAAAVGSNTSYSDLFRAAFGDSAITARRIAFAIATYERTLVADQTPWDRFNAGDPAALTPAQRRGFDFLRQQVCFQCHTPPLFTDNRFHNIGLRPWQEDEGRMGVTGDFRDRGRFKTASLRNVGLRRNLMHVGWIDGVADALDFYRSGAQPGAGGHVQFTDGQDPRVRGIVIPQQVFADVVEFLANGLTDPRVANGTFPFDRPTLLGERGPDRLRLFGPGYPGPGLAPRMIAATPLNVRNPAFKVGVDNGRAGAAAVLMLSYGRSAPGTALGALPILVDPGRLLGALPVTLANGGYGTVRLGVGDQPSLVGRDVFGQWLVVEPATPEGLAASAGARWRIL